MAYEAEQMSFLLPSRPLQETPEQQIQKVVEQLFERSAVLSEDALLAEVQNQNLGNCNLDELRKTLDHIPRLVNLSRPSGNPYFTTETNLKQENYVIETVNGVPVIFCRRSGVNESRSPGCCPCLVIILHSAKRSKRFWVQSLHLSCFAALPERARLQLWRSFANV